MFKIFATLALAIGLSATATQADARATWGQDLRFVADTKIPGTQGTMSLCHHVDYMDILFVPVYTTMLGYALSNSGCEGDTFRTVTAAEVTAMKASGLIPADVVSDPNPSILDRIWGHAWLILGALGLLKVGIGALKGGKGRSGKPDMLAIHSLVAMSQVAIADGRIDDSEVQQIANILTRLTGKSYVPSQVTELLSQLNPSSSDLDQIGQDLSEKDRQIVLEAALNIAVADGEIHPNEYAVVSELAQRMRIGADQFRSALARISAHLQTVQTT